MAGLKDIVKKIGLSPLKLESGQSVQLMALIEEMFAAIVDECKKKDGAVRIKDFGTFTARINKGRKLKTPLVEGGEVEFGDILLLKFHQSPVSKQRLNKGGTVKAWGGNYIEKKPRPSDIKKEKEATEKKKVRAASKAAPPKAPAKKAPAKKATSKAATSKAPASKQSVSEKTK